MTDEQKDIAQHMREWYEVFRRRGKGGERSVKAFLEAADLIEALAAEIEAVLSKLETITQERDALKADILLAETDNNFCQICAHLGCNDRTVCVDRSEYDCFEWRGVRNDAE